MRRISTWLRSSLQSKLLALVVGIVVLLLGLTMWIVNRRFTEQFHRQGRQTLETAQAVFRNSHEIQTRYFQAQYLNAVETPRARGNMATMDRKTIEEPFLRELLEELNCELIVATFPDGGQQAWKGRGPNRNPETFQRFIDESVQDALEGDTSVRTLPVEGKVFNIGAAPVTSGSSGALIGVLTFVEIIGESAARDFKNLTRTEIVIVAQGQVGVSTLAEPDFYPELIGLFRDAGLRGKPIPLQPVLIDGEHYLALTGHFDVEKIDPSFGYLLLNSYEQPLHDLRATQLRLLLVSLIGVGISILTVWFLVGRITQPLRRLREGVEAVGRDDFTHRLEIHSRDEFGDLGRRFNQMIQNLQTSRENLDVANKKLIEASRQAGMAEVATGVLHNVGNVLNSINVSTAVLGNGIATSRISHLNSAVRLMSEHRDDLGAFLSRDPKGRELPGFLERLGKYLEEEQKLQLKELDQIRKNLEHIKDIIGMQQSYATASGVTDSADVLELIEDAVNINFIALQRHGIELVREIEELPNVRADKHKILQILINLIRNAKRALTESEREDKKLVIRAAEKNGLVRIDVIDNGVGIPQENMEKIFRHGFTTKADGHGFGLHSGAIAAKEMGGSLTVESEGPGRGAAFTLEIPLEPLRKTADSDPQAFIRTSTRQDS